MTTFTDLGLAAPLLRALEAEGYATPTPIQLQAIPPLLTGKDLLGIAQTGTGKTAAFALPILHRLAADRRAAQPKRARVLVLSPTRELASQIAESFRAYGRFLKPTIAVVFGGVGHRPQIEALARGVDILVATPGRLLDHMESGNVSLAATEVLVLDEADQMLDLGFVKPIRRIVSRLPARRHNLFFSATMPGEIGALADELLTDPVKIAVTPVAKTADRVAQRVIHVGSADKRQVLTGLLQAKDMVRTLVFTRTKRGADRVARHLEQAAIAALAIHGNKSQKQREQALAAFKSGRIGVLVATDIAARGIDIDQVSHVVNFDLPEVPEAYVHRIGRTARAGAEGDAISLCAPDERGLLRDIERLTRQSIPAEQVGPMAPGAPDADGGTERKRRSSSGRGRGGRDHRGANGTPRREAAESHRRSSEPREGHRNGEARAADKAGRSGPHNGDKHRSGGDRRAHESRSTVPAGGDQPWRNWSSEGRRAHSSDRSQGQRQRAGGGRV